MKSAKLEAVSYRSSARSCQTPQGGKLPRRQPKEPACLVGQNVSSTLDNVLTRRAACLLHYSCIGLYLSAHVFAVKYLPLLHKTFTGIAAFNGRTAILG